MSRAVIQNIVSEMADAFIAAGLADNGTYQAPEQKQPFACRVFINRVRAPSGDYGSVINGKPTITLLLSEVPQPVRDAVIVADGQTFTLVKLVKEDDAVAEWDVKIS